MIDGMWKAVSVAAMIAAPFAICGAANAQPGIWIGSGKKDLITDKPTSLAFMASTRDEADIVVRCRSEGLDLLLDLRSSLFRFGDRIGVILRVGSGIPAKTEAVAVSNKVLALEPDHSIYRALHEGENLAVRFSVEPGPQFTLEFRAALRANALSKVGRPLTDCGMEAATR